MTRRKGEAGQGGRPWRTRDQQRGTIAPPAAHVSAAATGSKPQVAATATDKGATRVAGLYLVATPIGNAADITLRALRILAEVDVIACEDTRVTAKLLAIHGIARSLQPYHEHNETAVAPVLVARMLAGDRVALVADAGTPLISDPGYRLVKAAIEAGLPVVPLPGPSAVLAALTASGLATDRFMFAGFLPAKQAARRRALAEIATVPATLVFLDSPRRLAATLVDMVEILGDRPAAIARELTKLFEEIRRAPLSALASAYAAMEPPKGEVTIVVGPPLPAVAPAAEQVDALLIDALALLSPRDAATRVAAATGLPRRTVYARAIGLSRKP